MYKILLVFGFSIELNNAEITILNSPSVSLLFANVLRRGRRKEELERERFISQLVCVFVCLFVFIYKRPWAKQRCQTKL